MRTKTISIYKFKELSKDAQAYALDHNRGYHTDDDDWWDTVYEDAQNIGLKITEFECYRTIDGKLTLTAQESIKAILKNHGDPCDTYKTAKSWEPHFAGEAIRRRALEDPDEPWEEENEEMAEKYRKELLRDYLHMLEKEVEYLQSDECLEEALADYEFLETGEIA